MNPEDFIKILPAAFLALAALNIYLVRRKGISSAIMAAACVFLAWGSYLVPKNHQVLMTVAFALAGLSVLASAVLRTAAKNAGK